MSPPGMAAAGTSKAPVRLAQHWVPSRPWCRAESNLNPGTPAPLRPWAVGGRRRGRGEKGTLLGATGSLNTQGILPSEAASAFRRHRSTCGMRWVGRRCPIHFGLNSGCTSRPRKSSFSGQGWSVRNCRENPFPESSRACAGACPGSGRSQPQHELPDAWPCCFPCPAARGSHSTEVSCNCLRRQRC